MESTRFQLRTRLNLLFDKQEGTTAQKVVELEARRHRDGFKPRRRISDAEKSRIRDMIADEVDSCEIAEEFGITLDCLARIRKGKVITRGGKTMPEY